MRLPDYKMVSGGNTRVNMSAGAASQVGRAFASMGKDLQNAGMEVAGAFEEAERQHNAGKMADWQLELDEAYSNYQQDMASNPNNALEWRDGFTKLMQGKRSELEKRDISRNLKDQQSDYLKGFEGRYGIQVAEKMHSTMINNASQSIEVRVNDLRARGELQAAISLVQDSVGNGGMATARGEEITSSIMREQQDLAVADKYTDDPDAWLEKAEAGKVKGFSQQRLDAHIQKAKALKSINTMDNVNDVKNLIDGSQIQDEAELAQIMRDRKMDATSSYAMHNYFTDRNNEALKQFNSLPSQQNAIISRFEDSLRDYKPNGQPDDMGYARRITMLDKINNPHVKKEMVAKLDSLREGKEIAIKDKKDWALDQLSRKNELILAKHKANKPEVETRTLGHYLQDGWINGRENLRPYFDEDEIDEIQTAEDKNGDVTQASKVAMFKKLYSNNPSRSGNTDFQRQMAYAITKGGNSTAVTKAIDEKKMREWMAQDSDLHIRLGNMRESVMKRFEGRDISTVPYEELNKSIGSARIHDDPDTDWDDDLNLSNSFEPKTEEDVRFDQAYKEYATAHKLNPNPNDFNHHYDYRQAWEDGALRADTQGDLPSKYKTAGHPRTYMSPDGKSFSSRPKEGWTDTRTDEIVGANTGLDSTLVDLVKGFEGFKENAYDDYGQTSIGYGTVAGSGVTSITEDEAEAELKKELAVHQKHVHEYTKQKGYKFSKNELNALTSFAYNIGSINQLTANGTRSKAEIKKKMLEYVNADGKPLKGLKERRAKEAEMFGRG